MNRSFVRVECVLPQMTTTSRVVVIVVFVAVFTLVAARFGLDTAAITTTLTGAAALISAVAAQPQNRPAPPS